MEAIKQTQQSQNGKHAVLMPDTLTQRDLMEFARIFNCELRRNQDGVIEMISLKQR